MSKRRSNSNTTIVLTDKNPADWERAIKQELIRKFPITEKPLQDGKHPDLDSDPVYTFNKQSLDPTGEMLEEEQYIRLCHQALSNKRKYTAARQQATNAVTATVSDTIKLHAQNSSEYARLIYTFDYIGLIRFLYNIALGDSAPKIHWEALKEIMTVEMHRDETLQAYFERIKILQHRIQAYSRPDPYASVEESFAYAFVHGLGPQFKRFIENISRCFGQDTPLTVEQVIKETIAWEQAALSKYTIKQAHCRICGANHDKSECMVENPSCTICMKEGRSTRIINGHMTQAHIGPQTRVKPKPKAKKVNDNTPRKIISASI